MLLTGIFNTDSKAKKMAKQTYGEASNSSINIINDGTSIKGDINAHGDTRIDGELIGNITSKGRLVVGPKGKIAGEIRCNNVEVSGYIKGKVAAAELLTMKASAKIEGDIIAGKLSVEPGATFTGSCSMGQTNAAAPVNNEKEKTLYNKKS
jgi:cytoskeletal protein CcmA (bactofilin family)